MSDGRREAAEVDEVERGVAGAERYRAGDVELVVVAGTVAGQAIRALLRLRLGKPVGLVLDVDRDLGQRLGVHAAVVRAEEQLS